MSWVTPDPRGSPRSTNRRRTTTCRRAPRRRCDHGCQSSLGPPTPVPVLSLGLFTPRRPPEFRSFEPSFSYTNSCTLLFFHLSQIAFLRIRSLSDPYTPDLSALHPSPLLTPKPFSSLSVYLSLSILTGYTGVLFVLSGLFLNWSRRP